MHKVFLFRLHLTCVRLLKYSNTQLLLLLLFFYFFFEKNQILKLKMYLARKFLKELIPPSTDYYFVFTLKCFGQYVIHMLDFRAMWLWETPKHAISYLVIWYPM